MAVAVKPPSEEQPRRKLPKKLTETNTNPKKQVNQEKAKQHGSEFLDSVAVSYVVYDHPTGMNVAAVPDSIKEQYLDHYFTLPIDVAKRMQPYIKLLEETEHNPTTTKVLMNRMRNRDQIRGTNLLELWPEWEPYYGG